MITLNAGLKNSFVVLELLRNSEELCEKVRIHVECFNNGREHGLTFSMGSYLDDSSKVCFLKDRFTFCVYEHRNSDEIIINGKMNWSSFSGDLPYSSDSKNIFCACFKYSEHYKVAEWLIKKFLEIRSVEMTKKQEVSV